MNIAQIRGGRVTVTYGTDPRLTGNTIFFPGDISLVDASDVDGLEVGWYAAQRAPDDWVFGATSEDLQKALAGDNQPAAVAQPAPQSTEPTPSAADAAATPGEQPQDASQGETSDANANAQ